MSSRSAESKDSRYLSALILAGGYGSRLLPITEDAYPKHLYKIANKTLLEHTLEPLGDKCVGEVVLMLSYKASAIMDYFCDNSLKYFVTEKPVGIIPETKNAIARFQIRGDILIAEGDSIRKGLDIGKLYRQHINSGALSTVLATSKPLKNATSLHGVTFDIAGRVKAILQPDEATTNDYPLVGAVILTNEATNHILKSVPERNSWSGIMKSLQELGDMYAQAQDIAYFNVNTPEDSCEAETYLANL